MHDGVGVARSNVGFVAASGAAVFAFSTSLFIAAATATASTSTTAAGFHQFSVPAAVCIVEADTVLPLLAEPEWLVKTDADCVEPWVAGRLVGEIENDINLLKRPEGCLWIEEIYKRNDSKIGCCEYDPGAITYIGEGDRGDDNNTVVS